ncbi:MAG: sialidase family protein [Nitrososphaerota archaeon]
MRYRSKMFQRLLAIAIFTILIAGTISGILNIFNNSIVNSGGGSASYYSAFALKGDPQNKGDSKNKLSVDNSNQQQKTNNLIEKANQAAIEARLAANAANNATQNSKFLSSAAQEADKEVKKILDLSVDDSNGTKKKTAGENDNLGIALMDAKKKHKEAKLAAKNAKKLSDKTLAMEKEANKAAELARQAEKGLNESANKDTSNDNSGQGIVVRENTKSDNNSLKKVSEDKSLSHTDKSDSSSQIQDSKDLIGSNSGETSKSGSEALSDTGNLVSQDESKSIYKEKPKELVKDLESSKQSSDATVDGTGSVNDSLHNNSNSQISEAGPNYGEILAQAEKNIHDKTGSIITEVMKNGTQDSITSPPREGNTGISVPSNASESAPTNASSATVQNVTLIPEQITTTSSLSNDVNNNNTGGSISTSEIGSGCVNHDGITNNSDAGTLDMNNSLLTDCTVKTPVGVSDNNGSQIVPQISNDSLQYNGSVNCNIIGSNGTGSAIANTGVNSSVDRQADEGCYPQSLTSGQFSYIVWSEGDEDGRYILFKRSTDGGKTYGDVLRLSPGIPSAVFNPKVSSAGNNVYVVWQGDSQSGNQDILMRKSTDNGKTFAKVINVSNDPAGSGNPEIKVNSSSVFVVWDGTTPGSNEIFYRKSINNASNFDGIKNLSNDGGISYEPKVVLNKKNIEIYWRDYKNGQEEILMKKSLNAGKTFDILQKVKKDISGLWKEKGLDQLLHR